MEEPMRHLRRWGAVYLLLAVFLASWAGQFVFMALEGDGWVAFWSATLENWQSEFLQLAFQALVVVGAAGVMFRVSKDDTEDIKARLNRIERLIDQSTRLKKN